MTDYTIMAHRVPELEKRINRLNKKGGNITLTLGSERVEEWTDPETNTKHRRQVIDLELDGLAPVIAGWRFIAALEWLDGDNVVTTAPDVQCPQEYWHREPECEHCGLNRKRVYTFVLQSESGEYKQVGKTCLQDFLRSSDPGWAINVFGLMGDLAIWAALDPEECFGGGSPQGHSTLQLLGTTVGIIREYGWKARSKVVGAEIATADMVLEYLARNPFSAPSDSDIETARRALAWVAALSPKSDYEHNLKAVLGDGEEGFVRFKHAGIACSAIPVYRRAETASKAVLDEKVSEHWGEVGKRYRKVSARVTRVNYTEGMYGTTTIVGMVTPEGHQLVWFASGGIKGVNEDELVGCSVLFDGTVKGHGEFRGVKQTRLNRCKIVVDKA